MPQNHVFDSESPMQNEETEALLPKSNKSNKLKGHISEVFNIWQIRRNFFGLLILMSITSFCFFLITYQMKNIKGSMISNTLSQSFAVFMGNIVSGLMYFFLGPRLGFCLSYITTVIGSMLMLMDIQDYTMELLFIFIS